MNLFFRASFSANIEKSLTTKDTKEARRPRRNAHRVLCVAFVSFVVRFSYPAAARFWLEPITQYHRQTLTAPAPLPIRMT
jgi:hypothetical protein